MSNTYTIYSENLNSILFDTQSLSIWGDGDNFIEVGEILAPGGNSIRESYIDILTNYVVQWSSIQNGRVIDRGLDTNYEIVEGDVGGIIQYQIIGRDISGNIIVEDLVQRTDKIYNVNLKPTFISNETFDVINGVEYMTFPTDLALGSAVGIITSIDTENDPVVYSISGGADQDYFEIETVLDENGYLGFLKTKVDNPIDFETVKNLNGSIDVNGMPYVPLQVEITVADNYGSTSQIFNAAVWDNIIIDAPSNDLIGYFQYYIYPSFSVNDYEVIPDITN